MRLVARSVVLLCLLGVAADVAVASDLNGFLSAKGKGGVALSFTSEGFDEFWVGDSKVSDPGVGQVDRRSVSLWVGYGLTDRITLNASLPYIDVDSNGLAGFKERSAQDVAVLGKYRLGSVGQTVRNDFVVAGGLRTAVSDYATDNPGDVGDGTTDVLFRLVYQLNYRRFYASQQVGFDLRSAEAPNGFPLFTEMGIGFGRVTLSGFYAKQIADGGTDIGQPGFTFPGLNDESDRVGAKIFARVTEGLGVSLAGHVTLDGRNTPKISGVSAGIFRAF